MRVVVINPLMISENRGDSSGFNINNISAEDLDLLQINKIHDVCREILFKIFRQNPA